MLCAQVSQLLLQFTALLQIMLQSALLRTQLGDVTAHMHGGHSRRGSAQPLHNGSRTLLHLSAQLRNFGLLGNLFVQAAQSSTAVATPRLVPRSDGS